MKNILKKLISKILYSRFVQTHWNKRWFKILFPYFHILLKNSQHQQLDQQYSQLGEQYHQLDQQYHQVTQQHQQAVQQYHQLDQQYHQVVQQYHQLGEQYHQVAQQYQQAVSHIFYAKLIELKKNYPKKSSKKRILVISPNYTGGGLEKRLNTIFELLKDDCEFFLYTQPVPALFKNPPPEHVVVINGLTVQSHPDNLQTLFQTFDFDIVDVHPFESEWIIDLPEMREVSSFYTLHGTLSITESLVNTQNTFDVMCSVSDELLKTMIKLDPRYADKGQLTLNFTYDFCNPIPIREGKQQIQKGIIIYTNYAFHDDIVSVLASISHSMEFTLAGYTDELYDILQNHAPQHSYRNVGFTNIKELLNTNHFDMGICRDGYAAMDIISRNIPLILSIRQLNGSICYDLLSKENFKKLQKNNFCSWSPREKDYKKQINKYLSDISSDYKQYQCADLLYSINEDLLNTLRKLYKL